MSRYFKRVEIKLPDEVADLWLHHVKQSGFRTQQEAGVEAFKMHLDYLVNSSDPFYIVDELLYESSSCKAQEIEQEMARRLKRDDEITVIGRDGYIHRSDPYGSAAGIVLSVALGASCFIGFAIGHYLF